VIANAAVVPRGTGGSPKKHKPVLIGVRRFRTTSAIRLNADCSGKLRYAIGALARRRSGMENAAAPA
jgi:hypothetical protein